MVSVTHPDLSGPGSAPTVGRCAQMPLYRALVEGEHGTNKHYVAAEATDMRRVHDRVEWSRAEHESSKWIARGLPADLEVVAFVCFEAKRFQQVRAVEAELDDSSVV